MSVPASSAEVSVGTHPHPNGEDRAAVLQKRADRGTHPHPNGEDRAAVLQKRADRKTARRARKSGHSGGFPPVKKRDVACQRFRMVLSYDGRGFHGWQKQNPPGRAPLRTVEAVLEDTLRPLLLQKVRFFACGRTDSGVSAAALVAQFDAVLEAAIVHSLVGVFNAALPGDVRCLAVDAVDRGFNAMGNLWKRYEYRIDGDAAQVRKFCMRVTGDMYAPAPAGKTSGVLCNGTFGALQSVQEGSSTTAGTASTGTGTGTDTDSNAHAPTSTDINANTNAIATAASNVAGGSTGTLAGISAEGADSDRAGSRGALDLADMRLAAAALVGTHDFAGFQSRGGRATTVRTLYVHSYCNVLLFRVCVHGTCACLCVSVRVVVCLRVFSCVCYCRYCVALVLNPTPDLSTFAPCCSHTPTLTAWIVYVVFWVIVECSYFC